MMLFTVYILKCVDNSYYVGHTDNIEQRLIDHRNRKFSGYTSSRLPVKLVYFKIFNSRDEAFKFERQIKQWSRAKKDALIANNIEELKLLAKKRPLHTSQNS